MDPRLVALIWVVIVSAATVAVCLVVLTIRGLIVLNDAHRVLSRLDRMSGSVEDRLQRAGAAIDLLMALLERGAGKLIGRKKK